MKFTRRLMVLAAAVVIVAAACSTTASPAALTKIRLQLQWFPQAQFAGYFAAVDQGFYKAEGLDVSILPGGVDIVPATVVQGGNAEFGISWVPKMLAPRESGADVQVIAQVFQRSGTLQVAFKAKNITKPEDRKGKKVGDMGLRQRGRAVRGRCRRRASTRPIPRTSRSSRSSSTWPPSAAARSTPPRR